MIEGDGLMFDAYDPRRNFEIPAPVAGIFDTPFICVPINVDWVGHISGLLSRGAWPDAWGGDDAAKDRATDEIRKLLVALTGKMCMFKLMQSATNDCVLLQSLDNGVTWSVAFDFSLCLAPVNDMVFNLSYDSSQTIINNNYNEYITNPGTYAPNVQASDDNTNIAYCNALDVFVRAVLAALLERVENTNRVENIVIAASGVIATGAAILTGGVAAVLGAAIGSVVSLITNEIIGAIEEAEIRAVIESDELVNELVCCAYNDIKDIRLTQSIFQALWDAPCTGMDSKVVELLPVFQNVVMGDGAFIGFLDSVSSMHDYASKGLLADTCSAACVPACEATPDYESGSAAPLPTVDWLGGTRFRVTASQYDLNNRWYGSFAIPCGAIMSNLYCNRTLLQSPSYVYDCLDARTTTGTTVADLFAEITANNGDITVISPGQAGGALQSWIIEFDLTCP